MDLFLMRHADAVDGNGNDFSRTLTDRGRRQAERMGDWLRELKHFPLSLATSPYPRAHETAAIVASRLGKDSTVRPDERLAPGLTVEEGCALIHELGQSSCGLMLVGHAPDLSRLGAYLIGAKETGLDLRKGAVAHFETLRAGFGGSALRWLIDPKL